MHDVSRDSLYRKQWDQKTHDLSSGSHHRHGNHPDHPHPHGHHDPVTVQTDARHGHRHLYHPHDHLTGPHDHAHDADPDAFHHQHRHKHVFYHSHPHAHDRVRSTVMHQVFKDPVRDGFGLGLISLFIVIGVFRIFPEKVSQGLFLSAALIGLFPAMKNAIRVSLLQKKMTLEIGVVALLLTLLISGYFFEAAIASLFLLVGSFLHLDFSWDAD